MTVYVWGLAGIVVFYIVMLGVGIWAGTKQKDQSEEEVMLAGRNIGTIVGVLTLIATWVGGAYINSTAEVMFTAGLAWCQVPIGYSISIILGGEKRLGIPAALKFPYYDTVTWTQKFPFKTLCMLCASSAHLLATKADRFLFQHRYLDADKLDKGSQEMSLSGMYTRTDKQGTVNTAAVNDSTDYVRSSNTRQHDNMIKQLDKLSYLDAFCKWINS